MHFLTEARISVRCFGPRVLVVMLVLVMMCDGQVGCALQCKTRPIIWNRCGTVRPQHVAFRGRKRRRNRLTRRQVLVELLHEEERKRVRSEERRVGKEC